MLWWNERVFMLMVSCSFVALLFCNVCFVLEKLILRNVKENDNWFVKLPTRRVNQKASINFNTALL